MSAHIRRLSSAAARLPLVTIARVNFISPETQTIRKSARIKAAAPLIRSVKLRLRGAAPYVRWPFATEAASAHAKGDGARGAARPQLSFAVTSSAAPPLIFADASVGPPFTTEPATCSAVEPTEDSASIQFLRHLGIHGGPHEPTLGTGAAPEGSATAALLYCHELLVEPSAPSEDEAKCWVDRRLDQWQVSMEWRSEVAALCEEWLSASPAA